MLLGVHGTSLDKCWEVRAGEAGGVGKRADRGELRRFSGISSSATMMTARAKETTQTTKSRMDKANMLTRIPSISLRVSGLALSMMRIGDEVGGTKQVRQNRDAVKWRGGETNTK